MAEKSLPEGANPCLTCKHLPFKKMAEMELLTMAMDATGCGVWDWDIPTGRVAFSDLWFTMLGYEPGSLPSVLSSWEQLVHPDDLQQAREQVHAHLAGEIEVYESTHRCRTQSGTWCWILDRGKVVQRDADGNPLRMVGTHMDITSLKDEEEAFAGKSSLLQGLLRSIPDIVFFKDMQGNYLGCNAPFEELAGKTEDEVVGHSDREVFNGNGPRTFRLLDSLTLKHSEEWVNYPDGRSVLLDTIKAPLFSTKDSMIGLVGVGRDVTDRKRYEAELHYHAQIDSTIAMIATAFINLKADTAQQIINYSLADVGELLDVDRVYIFHYTDDLSACSNTYEWCAEGVVPQIEKLQNVPSSVLPWWAGQMQDFRRIILPDINALPPEAAAERELLQSQDIQSLLVVPMMWAGRLDGFMGFDSVRHKKDWQEDDINSLELLASIITNAVKHQEGAQALIEMNATLEKRVEERTEALKRTQAQLYLQEKLASIGQLAAGLAHEINNPVSFVSTNFAMLKEDVALFRDLISKYRELVTAAENRDDIAPLIIAVRDEEKRIALEYILDDLDTLFTETRDGFDRIINIINSMRDFSRSDKSSQKTMIYDLNKGIVDTLVISRNAYKYFAQIEQNLGTLPELYCMPSQINQVLLNIIVNAAQSIEGKGMTADEGRIMIRTWCDAERVYCQVADNGGGVDAAHISRLFEPFYTTKEPGKGTGLGLSISYDIIVNKHHGELTCKNAEGGGAVFTIALPRALDENGMS
ncbi:MAG: PAS domain S-box protein [Spartobacteria bacterium]|nr:PAS domain S-box protein [Spartobacteria bacterium]